MADFTLVSVGDAFFGRVVLFPFVLANYEGKIKFNARAVDVYRDVRELWGIFFRFRRDVLRSIRK